MGGVGTQLAADRALAQERRLRLAAEKKLAQREAELRAAHLKLARQGRADTHRVLADVRKAEAAAADLAAAQDQIATMEARLWQSISTLEDGFALFDSSETLVIANPAYLALFEDVASVGPGTSYGHILDVMIQEGIADLQGEPAVDWRRRMRALKARSDDPAQTIRLWNGRFLKVTDRATPEGGTVMLLHDTTELMRVRAGVEAIPDGFVLFDQDDRLVMCNDRYREIYGSGDAPIHPGTTFEDVLRDAHRRGVFGGSGDGLLEERLSRHRQDHVEFEQQLADGRWLRVLEKTTPDGGTVGLRVDITRLKAQQVALEEARARAEAASRAKSAFLANMSHELRTPMNGVVGMADLLAESDLDGDQRLYVDTIRTSGTALLEIINDVLDYSKIDADRLSLREAPFDLERLIHEIVMLMQPTLAGKSVEIVVDYDMFLPTAFVGDGGRIRQILLNLIGNAVKFTAEGHVLVRVVGLSDTQSADHDLHIAVEDTGIGIADEQIDKIFGEFNQVEDARNRAFEGTGLGLAITERLVGMMGGEIWVESELGVGSCFGLSLPLTAEKPVPETIPVPAWLTRAVVVDPYPVTRSVLATQLRLMGLVVVAFGSVRAAFEAAFSPGDVLFISHAPPAQDGPAVARRALTSGSLTACFVLTNAANAVDAHDLDGVGILHKPLLRRDLIEGLHSVGRAEPQEDRAMATPQTGTADAPRLMRVLAVEDNQTNRLLLSKMLRKLRIDLAFAENGAEAVDAFRDHPPDLVLTDISMPVMDGKEAARRMRAIEREEGRAHTPIVAMTAHALYGDEADILDAGIDHYMTKPVKKKDLVARIGAAKPDDAPSIEPDEDASAG